MRCRVRLLFLRQRRRCVIGRPTTASSVLCPVLLLLLFLLSPSSTVAAETQVKWTPNEEEAAEGGGGSGPLPLSNNQRQQLLQLEEAIRSSPDPQATLVQAAQANQMDPNELASLLQRNRQDLEAAGVAIPSTGSRPTTTRNAWKLFSSLGVVLVRAASKHPRSFALIFTSLLFLFYVAWNAPRTGLVLSSHRSLLSRGPTTVWSPPVGYLVDKVLGDSSRIQKAPVSISIQANKDAWRELEALLEEDDEEDGSTWHNSNLLKRHKTNLIQAASAQVTIDARDFLKEQGSSNEQEEEEEEDETDDSMTMTNEILDLCLDHTSDVLSARQLTEWIRPTNELRLVASSSSSNKRRNAILVVAKMGDWNRYGLLPLRVTSQTQEDDIMTLTLSTLRGGHWDGQIHVSVERRRESPDHQCVVVRTSLVVPKRGRKISRKTAMKIVEGLCQSIASSIETRTKQSLARRSQSSRFKDRARDRALERRHSRFTKEKELEEMAADRRRRWQRQNPNAGHYRPSGDRMKSPNNAVY